jgi:hypothetical protein
LPKLERKIDIESTPEKIYKIVIDGINTPKWNPTVSAVTPIGDKKIQLETDIGGMTINKTDRVENESVVWFMEKGNMNTFGYNLNPKSDGTEVKVWTEFDDKKNSKLFKNTADSILEGLKNFAEFIENGGDPKIYRKWEYQTI